MKECADRILVETGYIGANVSCITTSKGLVLIDSPFLPGDAKQWAGAVVERTGSGIAYQINTDHHFDHVLGNSFVTDRVICHHVAAKGIKYLADKKALLDMIRRTFPDLGGDIEEELLQVKIGPAEISFESSLTLDMKDATLRLEFAGGHSPGTILVHYVEENAVFTGDNVEEFFPYFGQSRFYTWKKVLQRLSSMDPAIVVPGHGEVGGRELVDRYCRFFQALEEEVQEFAAKGQELTEMAANSKLIEFFSLERMKEEGISREWVEGQYVVAAQKILSEKESPNH